MGTDCATAADLSEFVSSSWELGLKKHMSLPVGVSRIGRNRQSDVVTERFEEISELDLIYRYYYGNRTSVAR